MSLTNDIADELALQTMEIIHATGKDEVIAELSSALGGFSQTLEEAYMTAIRVRRAEERARKILTKRRKEAGLPVND